MTKWSRRCLFALAGTLAGLGYGLSLSLLQTHPGSPQPVETPESQDVGSRPVPSEQTVETRLPTKTTNLSERCASPPQGGPPVNEDFEPC